MNDEDENIDQLESSISKINIDINENKKKTLVRAFLVDLFLLLLINRRVGMIYSLVFDKFLLI